MEKRNTVFELAVQSVYLPRMIKTTVSMVQIAFIANVHQMHSFHLECLKYKSGVSFLCTENGTTF